MASNYTSQRLQNAFTFPFRDERWKAKLGVFALASLGSFLIVPGWFVWGYIHEIMRRIIVEREEPSLPEWERAGEFLPNGLKVFVLMMIFTLPILAVMSVYLAFIYASAVSKEGAFSDSALPLIMIMVLIFLMMTAVLITTVLSIFLPAALSHMVAKGEFSAAFRVREWWPIFRANLGGFVLVFAIALGANYLASFAVNLLALTIVLFVCLPFIMMTVFMYTTLVSYVLYAQAYVEGVERLAAESGKLEPAVG
jgi:hypothetical protein